MRYYVSRIICPPPGKSPLEGRHSATTPGGGSAPTALGEEFPKQNKREEHVVCTAGYNTVWYAGELFGEGPRQRGPGKDAPPPVTVRSIQKPSNETEVRAGDTPPPPYSPILAAPLLRVGRRGACAWRRPSPRGLAPRGPPALGSAAPPAAPLPRRIGDGRAGPSVMTPPPPPPPDGGGSGPGGKQDWTKQGGLPLPYPEPFVGPLEVDGRGPGPEQAGGRPSARYWAGPTQEGGGGADERRTAGIEDEDVVAAVRRDDAAAEHVVLAA